MVLTGGELENGGLKGGKYCDYIALFVPAP